ncbi:MAG: DUF4294 domain-containing protein [Kaistella sp.]|nr:DUF4294 domain-containing protein [Kaistella sp.]
MKFNKVFLIFFLFLGFLFYAQDTISVKSLSQYPPELLRTDEYGNKYYYDEAQRAKIYEIDGETIVIMDQLVLLNKPRFNNQLDRNYYYFLNKKLSRVYPLFLKALEQYTAMQAQLAKLDRASQKNYAREQQKMLADQYEAQLRDLTTTEGQIFAKLMDRATGKTVFVIIKELRGGWSAFWWNVKGNIANVDIKIPYNPHVNRTDEYLESLLQSNWNAGYLQPYPGYMTFKIKK